ncbi:hypothetical protein [Pseudazoarcus pumilus]|uniref:Uncharacterized protein n=1 Tax=Pseudazoarcus pumilus TaxID=2067960 RepID=A0A2I6S892_9RHOO|nr:hypothetical protein [Pseudazoarcus pumilus]AUN95431.1 hypothetical protein C0099_11125 [Pseudazoarcus pumilus]
MTTPPNRPQIQRPTLEDCRAAEKILRETAIEEALAGISGGWAQGRYNALALLGVISNADAEAFRVYCRDIYADALKKQEAA